MPSFGTVTETNAYTQDFNDTADGWIAGGTRSSWAHGHPAGATVNKDASADGHGGAWDTNLTGNSNAGEQSWVMSRCFDFSLAQRETAAIHDCQSHQRSVPGPRALAAEVSRPMSRALPGLE